LPGSWRANALAFAYTLTPLAGAGLFVGLTSLTAALAHAEGLRLAWLPVARAALLLLGGVWSVWLAHRQLGARVDVARRALSLGAMTIVVGGVLAAWVPFVFRGL
jgi:hypothetical protein